MCTPCKLQENSGYNITMNKYLQKIKQPVLFLSDKGIFSILKKYRFRIIVTFLTILIIGILSINPLIQLKTEDYIKKSKGELKHAQAAIILGAAVYRNKNLSAIAYDRLIRALHLYKAGIVDKILISGDHGQKNYDEVNTIKRWCIKYGVPERDIFTDHAGFSTYESIYRAKEIFLVESAIIVTQRYHLPRALYLAQGKNIKAEGYTADMRTYKNIVWYEIREYPARIKDFIYLNIFNITPRFLGKKIPITGDGRDSKG